MSQHRDRNLGIIVGLIIFALLATFVIIIFIGVGLSDNQTNGTGQPTITGNFLAACTTSPCQAGLACDGINYTCKYGLGAPCSNAADCITGLVCSGLCATGPTGTLNALCPCTSDYTCVSTPNSISQCKGIGGTPCTLNTDCASSLCVNGVCGTGSPNSFPCSTNQECASNNCNNGYCQSLGFISGTFGSACIDGCFGPGMTGAVCINTPGAPPLSCICTDGPNNPGTCTIANQGILSPCSNALICAENLVCLSSTGTTCAAGSCSCVFPFTDPNSPVNNECIPGMSISGAKCANNLGFGCSSGGMCTSNKCQGPSVLSKYIFTNSQGIASGTNFINATATQLTSLAGPIGLSNVHKLFSSSNTVQNLDTIYIVDYGSGLIGGLYAQGQSTPISWVTVLPYVQLTPNGTRTLIDAAFNGTTFIVAYRETSGAQVFDTVYYGPDSESLVPFNVQIGMGLPGTQYTTANQPITINYIDISQPNDISPGGDVLISSDTTIYVKTVTAAFYSVGVVQGGPMNGTPMTNVSGLASFYYDNIETLGFDGPPVCPENGSNPVQCPSSSNISFIGPFQPFGTPQILPQTLQFSGNVAGIATPISTFTNNVTYNVFSYSIYSPPGTITGGMQNSTICYIADVYNNGLYQTTVVAITNTSTTTILPYRVSSSTRCLATALNIYILDLASCN